MPAIGDADHGLAKRLRHWARKIVGRTTLESSFVHRVRVRMPSAGPVSEIAAITRPTSPSKSEFSQQAHIPEVLSGDDAHALLVNSFETDQSALRHIPALTRASAIPSNLPCCLYVDLCGESLYSQGIQNRKEQSERSDRLVSYSTTINFDIEWFKHTEIDEIHNIAQDYVRKKCNLLEGKREFYLISVDYSVTKQGKKSNGSPSEQSQSADELSYERLVTDTLSNPDKWKNAWNEQVPIAIAGKLVQYTQAALLLEVRFQYQLFTPHLSQCPGGITCLPSVIRTLEEQRVSTNERGVWFVPSRFFNVYFKLDVVKHLLEPKRDSEWDSSDRQLHVKASNKLWEFGSRMLATCIYAKLDQQRIYDLYKAGRTDDELPLSIESDLSSREACMPTEWTINDRDLFNSQQFKFCAHQFQSVQDKEKLHHVKEGVIMPFLKKKHIPGGNYADVNAAKMYGPHHDFGPNRSQWFAVKSFAKKDIEDFEQEKSICEVIAEHPHDHLTPFLTAWEDSKSLHILFPKAESDLHRFLMEKDPKEDILGKLPCLLEQMLGVSEGLASIHRLGASNYKDSDVSRVGDAPESTEGRQRIVCHHDLKPSNILVFRDEQNRPVLKITDFGLAKMTIRTSNPLSPKTTTRTGDWEYMSPEKKLRRGASRPSDMWSLSCIFLCLLLWFLRKENDNIEIFREDRAKERTSLLDEAQANPEFPNQEFWCQRARGGNQTSPQSGAPLNTRPRTVLKEAVNGRLIWLTTKAASRNSGVLKDLIRLLRFNMLKCVPKHRMSAPEVCSELRNFLEASQRKPNNKVDSPSRTLGIGVSTVGGKSGHGGGLDDDRTEDDYYGLPIPVHMAGTSGSSGAVRDTKLDYSSVMASFGDQFAGTNDQSSAQDLSIIPS